MENDTIIGGVSTLLASMMTVSQANQVFQWIQIVITVLCGVCTIISVIRKWYKDAKADGKITKDEIKDLQEKITDEISKIKEEDKKDGDNN